MSPAPHLASPVLLATQYSPIRYPHDPLRKEKRREEKRRWDKIGREEKRKEDGIR